MGDNFSAETCQKRWKGLRDKFVRAAKKTRNKSGDKGPMVVSSWPLLDAMLFLNDSIKHRRQVSFVYLEHI